MIRKTILIMILSLAMLSAGSGLKFLPTAHASGPIFTTAGGTNSPYPYTAQQLCGNCGYGGSGSGFSSIWNDNFGDVNALIPTSNNGNPFLQQYYFEPFVYNPASVVDLHLYISYFVDAYVYTGTCCGAWLEGAYGIADGSVTTYPQFGQANFAVPMSAFENDCPGACGNGGPVCYTTSSTCVVDKAANFDNEILSQCPGQYCPFAIGYTFTFVLMVAYTASPGEYVTSDNGGSPSNSPAYLYPGFWGYDNNFPASPGNFCTILSYQSSPVSGCPSPTCPPACNPLTDSITLQQQTIWSFDFYGHATGGTGSYTLWYWNFGDGTFDYWDGPNVYHSFCTDICSGQPYLVTLTVTDSQGTHAQSQRWVVTGTWGN